MRGAEGSRAKIHSLIILMPIPPVLIPKDTLKPSRGCTRQRTRLEARAQRLPGEFHRDACAHDDGVRVDVVDVDAEGGVGAEHGLEEFDEFRGEVGEVYLGEVFVADAMPCVASGVVNKVSLNE